MVQKFFWFEFSRRSAMMALLARGRAHQARLEARIGAGPTLVSQAVYSAGFRVFCARAFTALLVQMKGKPFSFRSLAVSHLVYSAPDSRYWAANRFSRAGGTSGHRRGMGSVSLPGWAM